MGQKDHKEGLPRGSQRAVSWEGDQHVDKEKVYKGIFKAKDTLKPKYFPGIKSALGLLFISENRN